MPPLLFEIGSLLARALAMKYKSRKLACILSVAILFCLACGAWWLEKTRAGELGRIFTQALANYANSSILMLQGPDISLKSGGIEFSSCKFCVIGPKQSFLVSIPRGYADIGLLELFMGNFSVREVRLDSPTLKPVDPDGIPEPWNIRIASDNTSTKANVQRLLIQKGDIFWEKGASSLGLEQINLSAALAGQQEAELKGDFLLKAGSKISGNLAFRSKIHYYSPNLTFRHTTISFTPLKWPLPIPSGPLRLGFGGALNTATSLLRIADCNIDWPGTSVTLKGAAIMDNGSISAELALENLPTDAERKSETQPMRLQGFLERQSEDMRLEEMAIQIGNISGSGEIVLEHDGERPTIGGRINFGKIFLGDVPILFGAFGRIAKTAAWPRTNVRVAFEAITGNGLAAQRPRFDLVGGAGKYDLKNLSFRALNGRIEGMVHLDFSDNSWRVLANGKKISIARLPFCREARGKANFQLKANGNKLPNPVLESVFNLEFDNFQCRPANSFLKILDGPAGRIFATTFGIDKLSGKLSMKDGNQGQIDITRAQNEAMNVDGTITFTLEPFTLDGKMVVHGQNGNTGLDFFWPMVYNPAIQ